ESAEQTFQQQVQRRAGLDRLAQLFIRHLRQRFALVYHPLWVIRYLYRQRAFQVVVDGYTGRVLYGKAPGNTLYRAAALVGGAAAGAFLMVDVPSVILYLAGRSSDSEGIFWFALGSFVIGAGLTYAGYRAFRYGEQYELRSGSGAKTSTPKLPGVGTLGDTSFSQMLTQVKDVEEWINRLS
ncbi:MAG: hypothetical protein JXB15_08825, partial [Anaerolineales bacterium]|nr:hypothetical protein [Anaerolineales bacterium]